jgi:hypothetical protein
VTRENEFDLYHICKADGTIIQILLFLEMLKFSQIFFLKEQIFVKQNEESFEIFEKYFFCEMES